MRLSEHFHLSEFVRSSVASSHGLANVPPPEAVRRLQALCHRVLEPLRRAIDGPIHIASGYRSPALNKIIDGDIDFRPLDLAVSQIGVEEATGNNDGIPSARYSGDRLEPWCANFVAWCYREAGTSLPGNQRLLASVQYMEDKIKESGKFIPANVVIPNPGDVIFFANRGDSDKGPGRHVGIVEKFEGGKVHTVEGNVSNRVARRVHDEKKPRITGYGRVADISPHVLGYAADIYSKEIYADDLLEILQARIPEWDQAYIHRSEGSLHVSFKTGKNREMVLPDKR